MSTTLLKTFTSSTLFNIRKQINQTRLKYKAAVVKSESSEKLEIEEKKRSKLAANEVRIQVHYCSVNAADLIYFKDPKHTFPFTPGYEFAGEVVEVGEKITKNRVIKGENVAALSLQKYGGFAEECVVNIDDIFRLPSNVQPKEAAVIVSGHSMAMYAFSRLRELKEKDYVLVTAGAAGNGLAAIDVAANVYEAKVCGVVDSSERAELAREKGAFETLIFSPKLVKKVLKATEDRGANVVYDAVGENMLETVSQCVASEGTVFYVPTSLSNKDRPLAPPNCNLITLSLLELRNRDVELYRTVVNDTLDLADQGAISAFISARYNFNEEDLEKAVKHLQEKKTTGKILIKMLK